MTLIFKNIIYRTTISCGCPVWLSSATILIVTIVLHINLLLPYISDPKAFQDDFRKQTRNESLAKLLLLTYLTVIILDLSFAIIGLWGILKRVPLLLLAYIVWSIFLMSAIAYAIYLVNKERSFSLEFYNSVVSPILALEYKPSSVGVVEIVMCIPILIKGFITTIVYTYYRTIVKADLQKQRNRIDIEDINVIIQTKVNEAVTSHMDKAHGSETS